MDSLLHLWNTVLKVWLSFSAVAQETIQPIWTKEDLWIKNVFQIGWIASPVAAKRPSQTFDTTTNVVPLLHLAQKRFQMLVASVPLPTFSDQTLAHRHAYFSHHTSRYFTHTMNVSHTCYHGEHSAKLTNTTKQQTYLVRNVCRYWPTSPTGRKKSANMLGKLHTHHPTYYYNKQPPNWSSKENRLTVGSHVSCSCKEFHTFTQYTNFTEYTHLYHHQPEIRDENRFLSLYTGLNIKRTRIARHPGNTNLVREGGRRWGGGLGSFALRLRWRNYGRVWWNLRFIGDGSASGWWSNP